MSASQRLEYGLLIDLPNDSNGLKGAPGSILLHAGGKKGKGMFLYSPVSCPLDRSLYPLADLFQASIMRSILTMHQLCAMTNHSHLYHCL